MCIETIAEKKMDFQFAVLNIKISILNNYVG